MIKLRSPLVMTAIIVLLSSCGPSREKPKPKSRAPEPPSLEKALRVNLVPLVDGGIYAVDEFAGAVWYVKEGKAMRVSGLHAKLLILSNITPTIEGGAYLHIGVSDKNTGLWYLKGETATKVQEVSTIAHVKEKPRSTEHWLWAMWQSERLRRESAEQQAAQRD